MRSCSLLLPCVDRLSKWCTTWSLYRADYATWRVLTSPGTSVDTLDTKVILLSTTWLDVFYFLSYLSWHILSLILRGCKQNQANRVSHNTTRPCNLFGFTEPLLLQMTKGYLNSSYLLRLFLENKGLKKLTSLVNRSFSDTNTRFFLAGLVQFWRVRGRQFFSQWHPAVDPGLDWFCLRTKQVDTWRFSKIWKKHVVSAAGIQQVLKVMSCRMSKRGQLNSIYILNDSRQKHWEEFWILIQRGDVENLWII